MQEDNDSTLLPSAASCTQASIQTTLTEDVRAHHAGSAIAITSSAPSSSAIRLGEMQQRSGSASLQMPAQNEGSGTRYRPGCPRWPPFPRCRAPRLQRKSKPQGTLSYLKRAYHQLQSIESQATVSPRWTSHKATPVAFHLGLARDSPSFIACGTLQRAPVRHKLDVRTQASHCARVAQHKGSYHV